MGELSDVYWQLQSAKAFRAKTRSVVHIANAPVHKSGFVEEASALDLAVLSRGSVLSWAFFYSHGLDPERLKRSLAGVLTCHPVVAGRVVAVPAEEVKRDAYRRRYRIDHRNAGVEFVELFGNVRVTKLECRVLGRRSSTEDSVERYPPYLEGIQAQRVLTGDEALMKVKLSFCADGGSILGVSLSSVLADAPAFAQLMHLWSSLYREEKMNPRRSFHSRFVVNPAAIQASVLAAKREVQHETGENPFLDDSPGSPRQQENRPCVDFDLDVEMTELAKEDYASLQGCIRDSIPDTTFYTAIGNAVKYSCFSPDVPQASPELNVEVVFFPKELVAKLFCLVQGSCSSREIVTACDAVCGLVWTAICDLRCRQLPGEGEEHYCSLSIDLRKDGPRKCVPPEFFGNASCNVRISGKKSRRKIESNPFLKLLHEERADRFTEAFVSATRRIAKGLDQARTEEGVTKELIRTIWSYGTAPWTSKVAMAADQALYCDCFLSKRDSLLWNVAFESGSPIAFQGMDFNERAYFCRVMEDADGGYNVASCIPRAESRKFKNSSVLSYLAPNAKFA